MMLHLQRFVRLSWRRWDRGTQSLRSWFGKSFTDWDIVSGYIAAIFRVRPTLCFLNHIRQYSCTAVFGIAILVARKRARQRHVSNFGLRNLKITSIAIDEKNINFVQMDGMSKLYGNAKLRIGMG